MRVKVEKDVGEEIITDLVGHNKHLIFEKIG